MVALKELTTLTPAHVVDLKPLSDRIKTLESESTENTRTDQALTSGLADVKTTADTAKSNFESVERDLIDARAIADAAKKSIDDLKISLEAVDKLLKDTKTLSDTAYSELVNNIRVADTTKSAVDVLSKDFSDLSARMYALEAGFKTVPADLNQIRSDAAAAKVSAENTATEMVALKQEFAKVETTANDAKTAGDDAKKAAADAKTKAESAETTANAMDAKVKAASDKVDALEAKTKYFEDSENAPDFDNPNWRVWQHLEETDIGYRTTAYLRNTTFDDAIEVESTEVKIDSSSARALGGGRYEIRLAPGLKATYDTIPKATGTLPAAIDKFIDVSVDFKAGKYTSVNYQGLDANKVDIPGVNTGGGISPTQTRYTTTVIATGQNPNTPVAFARLTFTRVDLSRKDTVYVFPVT